MPGGFQILETSEALAFGTDMVSVIVEPLVHTWRQSLLSLADWCQHASCSFILFERKLLRLLSTMVLFSLA
ncbi:hypothetical protein O6P43_004527 [Quillaja saponaria]|uniref:Uncharacterized protein n=1 Tax=Quillaja saponaria TaxID=32244 RepID=A0AAD7Q498_QUISA|nr:hypothetical protein O6P43_004527 [Quillaja saponaria]